MSELLEERVKKIARYRQTLDVGGRHKLTFFASRREQKNEFCSRGALPWRVIDAANPKQE